MVYSYDETTFLKFKLLNQFWLFLQHKITFVYRHDWLMRSKLTQKYQILQRFCMRNI